MDVSRDDGAFKIGTGKGCSGLWKEICRRAVLDHAALADKHHIISDPSRLMGIMGHNQNPDAMQSNAFEDLFDHLRGRRIEAGCGLIEQ